MSRFHIFSLLRYGLIPFGLVLSVLNSSGEDNWPRWRGPYDTGMAATAVRTHWSDTENVKWKVDLPGKGLSSPVIWHDKIFLTNAVPVRSDNTSRRNNNFIPIHHFEVWCISRDTGETLWSRVAKTVRPHENHHHRYGSFASNSPVTDGKFVYAYFGSRGVFAYDFDGNLIWQKDLGVEMRKIWQFGEGTAPVLHGNTLLLKLDHQGDSLIVALDKNTGKEIWRRHRDEITSWSAPLVIEYKGRTQAIVSATAKTRSYDLTTGEVIWEASGLGRNVIPNPVRQDDIVLVMSGYRSPNLQAIRLGGSGNITNSNNILWTNQRANSYTASPVLFKNHLFFVTDNGFASCFNATDGTSYYHQQRLPGSPTLKASPVGADDKLYIATENGTVIVLEIGEKFKPITVNQMGDHVFIASPAIADGQIFLRSETALFAIDAQ